jgi:predicted RNA-binding Zn ribbon-like protein
MQIDHETTARQPTSQDWRDGFVFVGNHLILDFLNTRPVLDAGPAELLPDAASLLRWLAAAGAISPSQFAQAEPLWSSASAQAEPWLGQISRLRVFREEFRQVVLAIEAGSPIPAAFVPKLNGLLQEYPQVHRLSQQAGGWSLHPYLVLTAPADAFAPLAADAALLLASADLGKLRKCANCVLHFLDTSKKGLRRWCSMRMCGNRSKVAAYSRRKKAELPGKPRKAPAVDAAQRA